MSQNWRNVLLPPTATLTDAIRIIDQEALRIALVVDERLQLLGTVTDGDIRRALMRQMGLDISVSQVMNQNPRVAHNDEGPERALELMEQHNLLAIPLVNDGLVVGLETLHHALAPKRHPNPVFLMAGGFGTRLRPLTDNCPKPLLKVGGKAILETILEAFVEKGFQNFYISTHYLPQMIRDHFGDGSQWGVRITYIHEEEPLGTGGALGLLPKNEIEHPLIMMNGDILTKIDFEELLHYHTDHDAIATMCVREYFHQIPYGVVEGDGDYLTSMVEKPEQKFFINAGVYVVDPRIIQSMQEDTKVDMPTLLQQQMDAGDRVSMFPVHEYWIDIGRTSEFELAQRDYVRIFE